MSYKVLITEDIDESGKTLLLEHGCEIGIGSGIDEDTVLREAYGCDAILTRNARITERILCGCANLKVVSMHGVGIDGIDVECATALGIQITNAARSNQSSVAEYTIGLMLALSRQIIRYNNELKAGNWDVRSLRGSDLEGKTLGIIGMGKIGTLVAKKAAYGFGMKVIGHKRRLPRPVQTDYALLTSDLGQVIRSADFLSLHVPGTPSTVKMIGAKELSLMKPEAYFINTARGEVVDEAALADALREKRIAGAAVDVFEGGVPSPDNPLLHLDNVIVSPHTAAFSREALMRMSYQAALGIVETLEGRGPTYPVNDPSHPTDLRMLKRG